MPTYPESPKNIVMNCSSSEKGPDSTNNVPPYLQIESSDNIDFKYWNILLYCCIIALSSFPLGWDVGTTGSLISNPRFPFSTISTLQLGIAISAFNIGCLAGSLVVGKCANNFNLKFILRSTTIFYFVGSFVELISVNRSSLIGFLLGRLLCGINCGIACTIGPLYMYELLVLNFPRKGLYISIWQTSVCLTILLGNLLLMELSHVLLETVVYFKVAFVIGFNLLSIWLPDSVLFHERMKNTDALQLIYLKLIRNITKIEFDCVYAEKQALNYEINIEGTKRKDLLICCGVMIFQQLTGINYFFYFAPLMFQSNYASVLLSLVNLLGSIISGPIIQALSVKTILLASSIAMGAVMVTFSTIGSFFFNNNALLSLGVIFVFLFSLSWGPCCAILGNAISKKDPQVLAYAIASNWLTNWIITTITPYLIQS